MHDDKRKPLPTSARYAAAAAIAAWPLGFLRGAIFSQGTDAAGAGYMMVFGVGIGALLSVFFGLVHWYCRKQRRIAAFQRHRRKLLIAAGVGLAAYIAWYVQPSFEDQRYSVRVKNWSSKDMSNVEVRFSNQTIAVGSLPAGVEIELHDFSNKPSGIVRASWVDSAGEAKTASERYAIGAPRRYDGGTVMIKIFSEYNLSAGFITASVNKQLRE